MIRKIFNFFLLHCTFWYPCPFLLSSFSFPVTNPLPPFRTTHHLWVIHGPSTNVTFSASLNILQVHIPKQSTHNTNANQFLFSATEYFPKLSFFSTLKMGATGSLKMLETNPHPHITTTHKQVQYTNFNFNMWYTKCYFPIWSVRRQCYTCRSPLVTFDTYTLVFHLVTKPNTIPSKWPKSNETCSDLVHIYIYV